MTKISSLLKLLLFLIFAGWLSVWLLKPTQLWTKTWKLAEKKASASFLTQSGEVLISKSQMNLDVRVLQVLIL